jgi:hypothetical protein
MQRIVEIPYRQFRTTYHVPSFNSRPLKMGPINCPKMSVRNYHYTLCMMPEERRYPLLCDRSLESLLNCCSLKKQDPNTASLYHTSLHNNIYCWAFLAYSTAVWAFSVPHMWMLCLLTLLQRWNFTLLLQQIFSKKCFVFCSMCITFMQIRNFSPCCFVLCDNTFAVIKSVEQGSFKEFSTHLIMVHWICS